MYIENIEYILNIYIEIYMYIEDIKEIEALCLQLACKIVSSHSSCIVPTSTCLHFVSVLNFNVLKYI